MGQFTMDRALVLVVISLFLTMTSTLTRKESLLEALLLNRLQINRLLNQLLQGDASHSFHLQVPDMPFKDLGPIVNNTGILVSNGQQKETILNKLNKTQQNGTNSPSPGLTSTEEPNIKMHERSLLSSIFNPGDKHLNDTRDKRLFHHKSKLETFTPYLMQHSVLQNSVMKQPYGERNTLHSAEIAKKTLSNVQNAIPPLPKLSRVPSVNTEMLNSNLYPLQSENVFQHFPDDHTHTTSGFQSIATIPKRYLFQHTKPIEIQENVGKKKKMGFSNSNSPSVHIFETSSPRGSSIFQEYLREPKKNDTPTTVLQGRVESIPIPITDIHPSTNLQENYKGISISGRVLNSKLIHQLKNRLHQHVSSPAKIVWSIGEFFTSKTHPSWSAGVKQNNSQDNQKPPNSQNNEPIVTVLSQNNSSDPKDHNSRMTSTISWQEKGPQDADRSNINHFPVNQKRQINNKHSTKTMQTDENETLQGYPMGKQGTSKEKRNKVTKTHASEVEVEEPEVESV